MSSALPSEGGCQCGEIRYRLTGEPVWLAVCHCNDCKMQSGGFRHEPQHARGRCQAHQRRAEVLDTPLREWRAGQKLLFLRNLRDTPLAHRRIRLLEHQTRHARRFVAVGTALRGMDEAQGAMANDRRARGQPLYTAGA